MTKYDKAKLELSEEERYILERAIEYRNKYKDIKKSFRWSHIEDLIAVKTLEKIRENKVIVSTKDKRLDGKNFVFKNLANKNRRFEILSRARLYLMKKDISRRKLRVITEAGN